MMDRYDIATGNSVTNMRRTPEMIIRKLISCVSRTFWLRRSQLLDSCQ